MSAELREQIELVREELADIDAQVRVGDLDGDTAASIRAKYTAELADLEARERIAVATGPGDGQHPEDAPARRRFDQRAILGIGIVAVAFLVIGVFAVRSLTTPSVVGADGIVADVVRGEGQVDLAKVTNEEMEAVVAENPDIVPMRLALARRYFEAGEYGKALDHYFEVLDREKAPEALANVGWMTYLSGRPDIAAGYVELALKRQPDYLAAKWYLANIYTTLGRSDEALPLVEEVLASNDVPDEVTAAAADLADQIRAEG